MSRKLRTALEEMPSWTFREPGARTRRSPGDAAWNRAGSSKAGKAHTPPLVTPDETNGRLEGHMLQDRIDMELRKGVE